MGVKIREMRFLLLTNEERNFSQKYLDWYNNTDGPSGYSIWKDSLIFKMMGPRERQLMGRLNFLEIMMMLFDKSENADSYILVKSE